MNPRHSAAAACAGGLLASGGAILALMLGGCATPKSGQAARASSREPGQERPASRPDAKEPGKAGVPPAGSGKLIDVNGGFEQCHRTAAGILMPVGWSVHPHYNAGEARAVYGVDKVKHGRFALRIEAHADGNKTIYVHRDETLDTRGAQAFSARFLVRGEGSFHVGFYQYDLAGKFVGSRKFANPRLTLRIKSGNLLTIKSENWKELTLRLHMPETLKGKKLAKARLFICVKAGGALFFDEFELRRIDPPPAAE